ncbi:MAG: DnaJ domain-containing protein [Clostridia bacterium]|nr:DnaJ domain-containing protein [Clostridia bacterium]
MINPFEVLGLKAWADADEVRAAYRSLVKACHPDMIQDPARKEEAQQRMVQINLAYEEALRLASPRPHAALAQDISEEEAVLLAEKMLARGNPESALRHLLRTEHRDGRWYYIQGKILMAMDQFDSAHQSYREAVRRDPENNQYRTGALDAAVALRESGTLGGRLKRALRSLSRK